MSRARAWWGSDHWQQFLIVATALMVALIFAGTLSALLTGWSGVEGSQCGPPGAVNERLPG